mgnify:CR=1 FL=1
MKDTRKVKIEKEREVKTYAELWHTSYCLLKKGEDDTRGSIHQFMASIVFTAFTLEAYLNHIGPKIFSCWDDLERLSPKEKLNVISDRLKVKIDYGVRPWQVMKDLFGFRNDIAHGKSIKIKANVILPLEQNSDDTLYGFEKTKWEKYRTKKNAIKAREDVESIINILYKTSGIKSDYPFVKGFQLHSAVVID